MRAGLAGVLVAAAAIVSLPIGQGAPTEASPPIEATSYERAVEVLFERADRNDGETVFHARAASYDAEIRDDGFAIVSGKNRSHRLRLLAARRSRPRSLGRAAGITDYYVGPRSEWRHDVRSYTSVQARRIYPGIDVMYRGSQGNIEYDFIVAPGGNPQDISFDFPGASSVGVDGDGRLTVRHDGETVTHEPPIAFQRVSGERRAVHAAYEVDERGRVGFTLGSFDRGARLVIDPIVTYSSYVGGPWTDPVFDIAASNDGTLFITGLIRRGYYGDVDSNVFVRRIPPGRNGYTYTAVVGGTRDEFGEAIEIDSGGRAYVVGETESSDFPLIDAVDKKMGDGEAFVMRFSPTGELRYSTFLGGSRIEGDTDIAVSDEGQAYVVTSTESLNFPVRNAYQASLKGGRDMTLTKLTRRGRMAYSTHLGTTDVSHSDRVGGVAVDDQGRAYVAGRAREADFPLVNAIQGAPAGHLDLTLTRFSPSGSEIEFSTYIGGQYLDSTSAIEVDGTGAAYITGWTYSDEMPAVIPANPMTSETADAFVTRVSPAGIEWWSYLGGTGSDGATDLEIGEPGVVMGGSTTGPGYPLLYPVMSQRRGPEDGIVSVLDPETGELRSSTYLGGKDYDILWGVASSGQNVHVAGETWSSDFPRLGAYDDLCQGCHNTGDGFVTTLSPADDPVSFELNITNPGTGTGSVLVEGQGCDLPCELSIPNGTSIDVTASAAPGSTFEGWSGGCNNRKTTCNLLMFKDQPLTVRFDEERPPVHRLRVTRLGQGTVKSTPAGISCGEVCSAEFESGTEVSLVAQPKQGWRLGSWRGACSGTKSTCVVAMDSNRAVEAEFVRE